MAVTTTKTNKPINPRGNDQSPKGYNRAALYSGKALDFDGVNDYVSMGTQSFITASGFSFSTKLYLEDDSEHYIFSTGYNNTNSILLYSPASSNDLVFAWYNTSSGALLSTGVNYTNDEWFDISVNYDGSILTIYKNGVEVVNESFSIPTIASGPYEIGWASPRAKSSAYLQGKVAGFKIFNTALTAAQVSDLYNNPEKIVPTGVEDTALKLWLPMMEGAGTTAYDGSGNGNHGTISGATYVHGVGSPVAQSAVIDWNKGSNLFAQSNDFSQSAWNLKNGTFTQGVADPIGGSQAWSWTATDTDPYIYQQFSVSGTHTMSIYAKGVGSTIGKNFEIRVATTTQSFVLTSEWQRFELDGSPSNTNLGFEYGNPAVVGDVVHIFGAQLEQGTTAGPYTPTLSTAQTSPVLLPQGLTSGRDITGVNLFENVRKQGALNLDGNSWAEVHDNASLDIGDFSLEAWVKFEKQGDYQVFFAKDDSDTDRSYELFLSSSETKFDANIFGQPSAFNTQTINNNQWYHVVATFTDSTNAFVAYVDGAQNKSATITASQNDTDAPVIIGTWYDKTNYFTHGQIAQPRIYNRALTAEEVLRNFNASKGIYQ